MKKLLYLIVTFTILLRFPLYSQDIIIKNNKAEIKAKVVEIQEDLIKYKLYEDANGPLRNIQISDVFIIIYETGKRETFPTVPNKKLNTAQVGSSESSYTSSGYVSQNDRPITKDNIVLGGEVSLSVYHSNGETKYVDPITYNYNYKSTGTSLSLSPTFGYFILDGLVLGLSPSFSYNVSKNTGKNSLIVEEEKSEGNSYTIGISPFIKYYFKSCIFVGLKSGYSYSSSKNITSGLKYTSNDFTISPYLGYAIFINSKISIEPCINYFYNKSTSKSSVSNSNSLYFSIGFQVFL